MKNNIKHAVTIIASLSLLLGLSLGVIHNQYRSIQSMKSDSGLQQVIIFENQDHDREHTIFWKSSSEGLNHFRCKSYPEVQELRALQNALDAEETRWVIEKELKRNRLLIEKEVELKLDRALNSADRGLFIIE